MVRARGASETGAIFKCSINEPAQTPAGIRFLSFLVSRHGERACVQPIDREVRSLGSMPGENL